MIYIGNRAIAVIEAIRAGQTTTLAISKYLQLSRKATSSRVNRLLVDGLVERNGIVKGVAQGRAFHYKWTGIEYAERSMERMSMVALSPKLSAMMAAIKAGDDTVIKLRDTLGITQASVSIDLSKLKANGFIKSKRVSSTKYLYTVTGREFKTGAKSRFKTIKDYVLPSPTADYTACDRVIYGTTIGAVA